MSEKTITVWNFETDEIEELTMDEDAYQAMVEYEEKLEFEAMLQRERDAQRSYDLLWYDC